MKFNLKLFNLYKYIVKLYLVTVFRYKPPIVFMTILNYYS